MLQLIDEYGIIDDFKLVNFDEEKNTNILGNNVKVVPTIIDSDHKEILEGIENKNDKKSINNFMSGIDIDMRERKYLNTISPFNYTGLYKL